MHKVITFNSLTETEAVNAVNAWLVSNPNENGVEVQNITGYFDSVNRLYFYVVHYWERD